MISLEDKKFFWNNGYLIVRDFYQQDHDKLDYIKNTVLQKISAEYKSFSSGGFETIVGSYYPNKIDLYTYFTKNKKVIQLLDQIFECNMTLDHSKLPRKLSGTGGFLPHQDAWYWQHTPWYSSVKRTASVFIALEDTSIESGCPQIYEQSHHEILPHYKTNYEITSNLQFKKVDIVLKKGDILIFHGNTIHSSEKNNSDSTRIILIGCYNAEQDTKRETRQRYLDSDKIDFTSLILPDTGFDVVNEKDLGEKLSLTCLHT